MRRLYFSAATLIGAISVAVIRGGVKVFIALCPVISPTRSWKTRRADWLALNRNVTLLDTVTWLFEISPLAT